MRIALDFSLSKGIDYRHGGPDIEVFWSNKKFPGAHQNDDFVEEKKLREARVVIKTFG
jgi:hypothetical protein